ncbi:hypothetical protein [Amycolatopsis magusensis]|uniref:hypothetical protein n=1 Tax=Amycolatopsis magusensis TaxID=882444 RepID=UPI00379483AE
MGVVLTSLFAGLVVAGAGVLVAVAELDNADKIASVIGAAAGVLGLGVSVASAVQVRRLRAIPPATAPSASNSAEGPANAPVPTKMSMRAKARDDARIYQSGGSMNIHER